MDVKQVIEQQPSLKTVLRSNTHWISPPRACASKSSTRKIVPCSRSQLGVGTVRRANSQRVGVDHRLRSEPHQHQRSHRQPAVSTHQLQQLGIVGGSRECRAARFDCRRLTGRQDRPSGRIVRVRAARPRQLAKTRSIDAFRSSFEQTHRAGRSCRKAAHCSACRRIRSRRRRSKKPQSESMNRDSRIVKRTFLTNPESRVTNHVLQGI